LSFYKIFVDVKISVSEGAKLSYIHEETLVLKGESIRDESSSLKETEYSDTLPLTHNPTSIPGKGDYAVSENYIRMTYGTYII
jgi:hypothetical protein